jgi:elongation factor Tu
VCEAYVKLDTLSLILIPGGRYTPFMVNYRPQLFLRTADITVALTFPQGTPDAAEKMVSGFDNSS